MAKRHPTSRRRPDQKRRDEEAEDLFVAKVYEASTWARHNRTILVILGVVLAVAGFGVYSWTEYRARLEEQAVLQLEQIQQTLSVGDPETAKAELNQYLSRFDGTPYAAEARMLLADLYLRSEQSQQAIDVLDASNVRLSEPIGPQIETLKAKAYEAAGRLDQAEDLYLRVADRAELQFQAIDALSDAARIREAQGDWSGAATLYERILDELGESGPDVGPYRMRLAEARTAAGGSSE
ncbi:MAG: tetratricopeptide repeat protein [Gemmatimonadota bacterium]|jgi:tetratricopeptide (TPR) repeat protein